MSSLRSRSGGSANREDVQPVEQVLAQLALAHGLGRIDVGGGDDADVHGLLALAAERPERPFLQDAQQLGLRRRRHLRDLVEEQRAAVGQLERALPPRDRAGERALLVAEQLRLEQRVGNRRAVERHERLRRARAELVDGLRDQFLAGARLAADQHRGAASARPARPAGRSSASRGCAPIILPNVPALLRAGAAARASRAACRAARRSDRAGS